MANTSDLLEKDAKRARWISRYPRWAQVLIGLLAFWPLVALLGMMFSESYFDRGVFFVWIMTSVYLVWFFFLFDAALSKRVPSEKKRLWVVVLILGHMIAIIFYWYFYIRSESHPESKAE